MSSNALCPQRWVLAVTLLGSLLASESFAKSKKATKRPVRAEAPATQDDGTNAFDKEGVDQDRGRDESTIEGVLTDDPFAAVSEPESGSRIQVSEMQPLDAAADGSLERSTVDLDQELHQASEAIVHAKSKRQPTLVKSRGEPATQVKPPHPSSLAVTASSLATAGAQGAPALNGSLGLVGVGATTGSDELGTQHVNRQTDGAGSRYTYDDERDADDHSTRAGDLPPPPFDDNGNGQSQSAQAAEVAGPGDTADVANAGVATQHKAAGPQRGGRPGREAAAEVRAGLNRGSGGESVAAMSGTRLLARAPGPAQGDALAPSASLVGAGPGTPVIALVASLLTLIATAAGARVYAKQRARAVKNS